MSHKQKILNLLRESPNDWFPNYKLSSRDTSWGWIGSQGDRRARELYQAGLIERQLINRIAHYRHKPPKVETYQVVGNRTKEEIKLPV